MLVAAVALGGALLGGLPSAGALTATEAAVTMQGGGGIAPGLTAVPTAQVWNFNALITVTGDVRNTPVVVAQGTCGAIGGSTLPETYANGAGGGLWNCTSGPFAGYNGTLTYVRAGLVVGVVLQGDLTGAFYCEFAPGQTPPATVVNFNMACIGAVTDTV
jgi:hypothetical protein